MLHQMQLSLLLLLLPTLLLAGVPNSRQDLDVRSSCAVAKRPTVNDAVNELFTCLLTTRVEPTNAFRAVSNIDFRGIAGSGVTQAPLLKGVYSVSRLSAESESYRRYFDVARIFTVELGIDEVRGPTELSRLEAYLTFLEQSPIVRDTYETLRANLAIDSGTTLRQFVRGPVYDHWFKQYARTAKAHEQGLRESSGFGHVFVGELKSNAVTGFHSWVQLLSAEEAGTFDYKGYVRVARGSVTIGGIQFGWMGKQKSLSSVMFGVPPEFELALYSACFVVNHGRKTDLSIKGTKVSVQTHYVNHQTESVATAYPVV